MLFQEDILDVCLNVTTTGSTHDSMILDFALHPLNPSYNPIYVERTDIDVGELIFDEDRELYNNVRFKDLLEVDHTGDSGLIMYKDHDNQIINKMQEYLLYLSDEDKHTIRFWVDNPMDWFFFTNLVFPKKRRHLVFPEFVDVMPMSFTTVYRMMGREYSDYIKEILTLKDDLDEGNNLGESNSIIFAKINYRILDALRDSFIKI